jgi:hypothetical protein
MNKRQRNGAGKVIENKQKKEKKIVVAKNEQIFF